MRVKLLTLGCKVNQYETQALKEEFLSNGCQLTEGVADLYVVNTCTVTSRADSKSKETILKAKRENPQAKIAVSGCLVQLNRGFIEKLGVDYIIPQDKKQFLVDFILDRPISHKDIWSLKITEFFSHRAFVKVQDGCDNFCSFCKVPYVRGASYSREKNEVIDEVKKVSFNHKEVVICGINLGLYGKELTPPQSLTGLIREIFQIDYLHRLRLSSLEPSLVSDTIIEFFSYNKLCPHIHLPFQSGDDKILKEMNKKDSVSLYEEVVRKIRKINPFVAISCDIMVGFPYEDEESFQNTLNFLKRIKPMRMHIFTFSPREKTPLFGMKIRNQRIIHKRYDLLRKLSCDFSLEYKKRFLGQILYMLTEEKKNGYICGYTENYIKVYLKEKVPLGEILPVRIEKIEKERVFVCLSGN